MRYLLALGVLVFLIACQQNKSSSSTAEVLPNTPELVVRQYQAWMDSNRFEKAALLSTAEGKAMLEMLAEIMEGDPPDSTIIHTEILDINCVEQKLTALCICLLRDEYEEYESQFNLVKENNQWLVDVPEEEEMEMTEEEMEEDAQE